MGVRSSSQRVAGGQLPLPAPGTWRPSLLRHGRVQSSLQRPVGALAPPTQHLCFKLNHVFILRGWGAVVGVKLWGAQALLQPISTTARPPRLDSA